MIKSYLHINNTNCNWKVGDEFNIGIEDNNYWKSFVEKGESIEIRGRDMMHSR